MKTLNPLPLLLLIALAFTQAPSQCEDLCYLKQSELGKCSICYSDCQNSDQASFLSCSIQPPQGEEQELTEDMCKTQCYPQKYSSPDLTSQNPDQLSLSLEELEKLKRETEGWAPQSEKIVKAFLIMFGSSLLFIAGFTMVWRHLDRKKKLRELEQKQNKEWVKCFQKLNTSDTTICSTESKETTQCLPAQPAQ